MPSSKITLVVPESIVSYRDFLQSFFDGMIDKLDQNSFKKTPTTKDIPGIIDDLQEEILEFEDQLARDKFDRNTLVELMDAANFAFLAYVALRIQGVEDNGRT